METKNSKKNFSSMGFRFLIGTLIIYAVQIGITALVSVLRPQWLENMTITLIVSVLPMYLIGMPALIALVRQLPGQEPVAEKKKISPGQFLIALLMCFALMYCGNMIGTLITTVIGIIKGSEVENAIMTIATGSNMFVTFFYMVLCAPVLEEYVFRKLIVDRSVKYGQGVAVILSGLMFGLFHGNLNQFAYAFLLGMFLAFIYVKTGDLRITIGLHMCINFVGGIVSVWVLKGIHLEEYISVIDGGMQTEELMNFIMANLAGWIIYLIYLVAVLAAWIAGVVLLIVFRGKFRLEPGQIPKGQRFQTVICNPGMICYCIFWLIMILWQMFPEVSSFFLENFQLLVG